MVVYKERRESNKQNEEENVRKKEPKEEEEKKEREIESEEYKFVTRITRNLLAHIGTSKKFKTRYLLLLRIFSSRLDLFRIGFLSIIPFVFIIKILYTLVKFFFVFFCNDFLHRHSIILFCEN